MVSLLAWRCIKWQLALNMKPYLRLLLSITVCSGLVACATKVTVEEVTVDIPASWKVERTSMRVLTVRRHSDPNTYPVLSIESIPLTPTERLAQCQPDNIRAAFFFPALLKPASFTMKEQSNGVIDYSGIGTFKSEEGTWQLAMRLLCLQNGIVYFGVYYENENEEEPMLWILNKIVKSVRWNAARN